MKEPVVAPSGYTYEREVIIRHINKNPTDPFTGEPLQVADLRPNRALKDAIEAYVANQ